jgi:hypothetical protein
MDAGIADEFDVVFAPGAVSALSRASHEGALFLALAVISARQKAMSARSDLR